MYWKNRILSVATKKTLYANTKYGHNSWDNITFGMIVFSATVLKLQYTADEKYRLNWNRDGLFWAPIVKWFANRRISFNVDVGPVLSLWALVVFCFYCKDVPLQC